MRKSACIGQYQDLLEAPLREKDAQMARGGSTMRTGCEIAKFGAKM
jgi:hypothetical protein